MTATDDVSDAAARRVIAAVIVQAIVDAQRGDPEAAAFLDEFGERLCWVVGYDVPRHWRRCKLVREARREMVSKSEAELREQAAARSRRYWARHRAKNRP